MWITVSNGGQGSHDRLLLQDLQGKGISRDPLLRRRRPLGLIFDGRDLFPLGKEVSVNTHYLSTVSSCPN